jgi:thiamine pyrophosphate-dependent acetolactate synthase large subunit-like protein
VLFTGEGSLQLTEQEISTILRHDLKPFIFVINNRAIPSSELSLAKMPSKDASAVEGAETARDLLLYFGHPEWVLGSGDGFLKTETRGDRY